ncbi:hypothetical protein GZH46_00834 [Fragariocoptes setiger]|uniref:Uncharacterized protein n=1 Tax=Fragariocoptes setiger TaxID=1670756 RepID=A0ABQ7SB14_9ACAR|nr:hypothetical protein GZH46_00834 [Fragariocoptes setiger]
MKSMRNMVVITSALVTQLVLVHYLLSPTASATFLVPKTRVCFNSMSDSFQISSCTGQTMLAPNITQAQAFCIATACLQVPITAAKTTLPLNAWFRSLGSQLKRTLAWPRSTGKQPLWFKRLAGQNGGLWGQTGASGYEMLLNGRQALSSSPLVLFA